MFVDSHCHLAFPELAGDIDGVLARMSAAGVGLALSVCTRMDEFERVQALAARDGRVYASVGVHPDTPPGEEPAVGDLVRLASLPRVVAIGETGLDYYRLPEPLDWQRNRFRTHIRAARESGKPLIIHTRSASEDTLRIMRDDLGFFISFSGIVTFKNARELQAVAQELPLERLLIETDAPYLAPVPVRGRTNEPAYVVHVAAKLAELKGISVAHVQQETTENFRRCFKIL